MKNLEEINTYNLLTLSHEDTEHLIRSITKMEIKSAIKIFPAKKSPILLH